MKQKLLFTFLILFYLQAFGQKEYNVWYFGNKAGITFNTNPPSVITDGQMNTYEGSSGVCDENGNLLFYTNGDTVWNKNHQYMKNGISPVFYKHASGRQGSIVIKKPGTQFLYYIFSPISQEVRNWDHYLRYWLIDMSLDGGLGEAMIINDTLLPNIVEFFAVTRHANNNDFWIAGINSETGQISCIRTENGGFGAVTSSQTSLLNYSALHTKFTPNGEILLGYAKHNSSNPYFSLFRFDNNSGLALDRMDIEVTGFSIGETGAEFSHDSKFLYITLWKGSSYSKLVQFDVSNWDKVQIEKSMTLIDSGSTRNEGSDIASMQLGPDKKIYVFPFHKGDSLSIIDYPYKKGGDCTLRKKCLSLNGGKTVNGGFYCPSYFFDQLRLDVKKRYILCKGDSLILDTKIPFYSQILWNTGDTTRQIIAKMPGWYSLHAINYIDTLSDSFEVVNIPLPTIGLGNDTNFCASNNIVLSSVEGDSFLWSTGESARSINVMTEGEYWVIANNGNCRNIDTINVSADCKPLWFIPNAFTPGGDNLNDVFKVYCNDLESVKMEIYNCWGEKIFEENGIQPSWNGTSEGKACQQGVYVYSLTIARNKNGIAQTETISGNVTLLR